MRARGLHDQRKNIIPNQVPPKEAVARWSPSAGIGRIKCWGSLTIFVSLSVPKDSLSHLATIFSMALRPASPLGPKVPFRPRGTQPPRGPRYRIRWPPSWPLDVSPNPRPR